MTEIIITSILALTFTYVAISETADYLVSNQNKYGIDTKIITYDFCTKLVLGILSMIAATICFVYAITMNIHFYNTLLEGWTKWIFYAFIIITFYNFFLYTERRKVIENIKQAIGKWKRNIPLSLFLFPSLFSAKIWID